MTRDDAQEYISYAVDDALSERDPSEAPANARLVGWQCGFEPLFVAVWSYLDVRLEDDEAEELAADLLHEKGWFAEQGLTSDELPPADFII